MAVKIITDSTCDLEVEEGRALGIEIVPLHVIFPDSEYLDGINLSKQQFYRLQAKSPVLPKTSQATPEAFAQVFRRYPDDELVVITISSKLSATYQSAFTAKSAVENPNIWVVDSKTAALGLALLVLEAVKLRDKGYSAAQIAESITALTDKVKIFGIVDTLKFLKMGGRLSSATAIIGEMLNIKPIISVIDGEVKSIGKGRGKKGAYKFVLDALKKDMPSSEYEIIFAHSDSPEQIKKFIGVITSELGIKRYKTIEIGCVVGTHTGPDTLAISYISRG